MANLIAKILEAWAWVLKNRFAMILVGVGVGLFLLLVWINSCNRHRTEDKIQRLERNAETKQIEANVAENTAKQTNANVNAAKSNVAIVEGKSANNFGNSFPDLKRRYCRAYPEDKEVCK